jgi:hypothetical protein
MSQLNSDEQANKPGFGAFLFTLIAPCVGNMLFGIQYVSGQVIRTFSEIPLWMLLLCGTLAAVRGWIECRNKKRLAPWSALIVFCSGLTGLVLVAYWKATP